MFLAHRFSYALLVRVTDMAWSPNPHQDWSLMSADDSGEVHFWQIVIPRLQLFVPCFYFCITQPAICVIFFSPKTSPMFWMWFLIKAFSSKYVLLPFFFSGIEDSLATDFCHAAKPQTNCGRISQRVDHLWFLSFFNNCTSWCETSRDIIYRSRQIFRCRCEKPRSDRPQRK